MQTCCCYYFINPQLYKDIFLPVLPLQGDHLSRRSSPRPLRASLVSSSSTSSFRRALSSTRATLPVSPVVPPAEQAPHMAQAHNVERSSPQNLQPLDPDGEDLQGDVSLDMQEVSTCFVFYYMTQLENGGHAHQLPASAGAIP